MIVLYVSINFTYTQLRLYENIPSAGSPTETLLRLLLPLNNFVQF